MFLFGYFSVLLCFVFHIKIKIKIEKSENNKNSVCMCKLVLVYLGWSMKQNFLNFVYVYIGTCVPWMTIETKFSKLCVSCSLDEHLYAQLSK